MIEGNILPPGTIYKTDSDMTFIDWDKQTGEKRQWVYPAGTAVTVLKHKVWREAAYRGVDYEVEMPDGYKTRKSANEVHRILGLPKVKVARLKSK